MNPKPYADILAAVAADHMPARLDLFPHLSARLEKKSLMQTVRTRPVLALVLVVLALLMLSGVVYALGRLAGFIPGFGFSSDASAARVLAAPVQVTNRDVTIRVEQAATDTDKFWLRLSLNRLPYPDSVFDALLRLPDGRTLPFQKTDWQGPVPGQPVPAEIPISSLVTS